MTYAVIIENLQKSFVISRGNWFHPIKSEIMAVNGINFSVQEGESIAFLGPNGAGKSTTIKMLTGILHPSSGNATVLGFTPWKQREKLACRMGAVFGQRSQLWYHLPPSDTFDLLSKVYELDNKSYQQRKNMLIERFDIGPFLNTPVRKLSLGQRMRAEIAASLLHRPQILFLDEPTIGLDVVAREELRNLIRQWNQIEGLTVFLTSHDAGDVASVADRAIIINHGSMVFDNSLEALRRGYLGSKIVSVKFHDSCPNIDINGVSILESDHYSLTLEVNTSIAAIEKVVNQLLQSGSVADITIEDPPLEEIIAHIYNQRKDNTIQKSESLSQE